MRTPALPLWAAACHLPLLLAGIAGPYWSLLLRHQLLPAIAASPGDPTLLALPVLLGADDRMLPPSNYGVRCMSMGFLMEEDVAAVWRGPMVGGWAGGCAGG